MGSNLALWIYTYICVCMSINKYMLKLARAVLYTCTSRFQNSLEFNPQEKRNTQFRGRPTEEGRTRGTTWGRPRSRRRTFVDWRRYWVPKRKIFKYKKRFLAPLIPSEDRVWNSAKISCFGRVRELRYERKLTQHSKKRSLSMQKCFWTLRPTHVRLFAKSFEEFGRITPVRMNFLNSKHQRYAASLVKRARLSGLLPFRLHRRTFGHRFRYWDFKGRYFGWLFREGRKSYWFWREQREKRKNDLRDSSLRVRKCLHTSMSMIFLSLKYSVEQINNFFYLLKVKGGLTKRAYYLFFGNIKKNINILARRFPRSFFSLRTQALKLKKVYMSLWLKKDEIPEILVKAKRAHWEVFNSGDLGYCTTNTKWTIGLLRDFSFNFRNMCCKTLMVQIFQAILLEERAHLYKGLYMTLCGLRALKGVAYIHPPYKGGVAFQRGVGCHKEVFTKRCQNREACVAAVKPLAERNWWKKAVMSHEMVAFDCQNQEDFPRELGEETTRQRFDRLPSFGRKGIEKWPRYVLAPEHRRKALCEKSVDKILKKKQKVVLSMFRWWGLVQPAKPLMMFRKQIGGEEVVGFADEWVQGSKWEKHIKELLKRLAEVARLHK